MSTNDKRPCDDYIHDYKFPVALRVFLLRHRLPAIDGMLLESAGFNPKLFATYEGKRVRVTMASRLGDVGITEDLDKEHGYHKRVYLDALSDFKEEP